MARTCENVFRGVVDTLTRRIHVTSLRDQNANAAVGVIMLHKVNTRWKIFRILTAGVSYHNHKSSNINFVYSLYQILRLFSVEWKDGCE